MSSRYYCFWSALILVLIMMLAVGCSQERGKTAKSGKESAVAAKKTDKAKDRKKSTAQQPAATAPAPSVAVPSPMAGGLNAAVEKFLGGGMRVSSPGDVPVLPNNALAKARPVMPKIAPGKRPTAAQLLQLVQANYGNMKSLKLARVSSESFTQDGKVVAQQKNIKSSFIFKRPNKFVVKSGDGATYSDGRTVYEYNSEAKRFIKGKMSDDVLARMVMGKPGISIVGLLLGMDYTQHIRSSKLLADSKVGSNDTYVLSLDIKAPKGATANHKLWIGKKNYGIYKEEFNMSMTPQAPPDYKGKLPKSVQNKSTATFTEFAPNVTLADSSFAFKPPAGAKEFEPPKEMKKPEPLSLLDKHAPDFSFKWTDGTTKKLSDFRGRVVVLDFWALPLADEHLPVLHSVNKSVKEGVEFITICLNDDQGKISEYMKGKGFSFPVVMANESMAKTIMEDYRIMGVPTIYVIDKEGIVRRQVHGSITEADFNAKIDKVATM